jgi:uncharacterized protein YecE (DUF72 family)
MAHAGKDLRIGTAGWSVPKAYDDRFPEDGSHLERYAQVFSCVEINSSFYRPHQRKTYERWAGSTAAGFRFAVKAPRQITHVQRLKPPFDPLDRFMDESDGLGSKLGPTLVQLPPSLPFEPQTAEPVFRRLQDAGRSIACEPRHRSWFAPGVDAWLAARRIARVAADPAPSPGAEQPGGWDGLIYVRMHGSPRMYYSDYSAAVIDDLAMRLRNLAAPAWCIFDNTAAFAALGDALSLQERLAAGARD